MYHDCRRLLTADWCLLTADGWLPRAHAAGVSADQWLFERISEAAVAAAADGGVWRSGGKYILSALSRNQSPVALQRYLTTMGQQKCALGIEALVKWTEQVQHAGRGS